MTYSRKKFVRRNSRKGSKRTYKRKTYKRQTIKKIVKAAISRNVEKKTAQSYVLDRTLGAVGNPDFITTSSPVGNMIILGPDPGSMVINQGVGQGDRIGNAITMKKLVFKGTLVPLPYDAIYNGTMFPVQVKMWIFYDRTDPNAIPDPRTNFFQSGNTSKGWSGDLVDMWSPINEDRYRVVATKTFKLGYGESAGSGPTPNAQYFANNDFKLNANFSFDLTKHYVKHVKFNDTSTSPTTRGLFCIISYAPANGSLLGSGIRAVGMQWMQSMEYTDA